MYFADAELNWEEKGEAKKASFFGGNIVAMSPAMYAVYQ